MALFVALTIQARCGCAAQLPCDRRAIIFSLT